MTQEKYLTLMFFEKKGKGKNEINSMDEGKKEVLFLRVKKFIDQKVKLKANNAKKTRILSNC